MIATKITAAVKDFFKTHDRDFFTKTVIFVFLAFMLTFQSLLQNKPMGESTNFMLTALALESRLSLKITQDDVERAKTEFPAHGVAIESHWDNWRVPKGRDGRYSYYFGTYSFTVIPVMKLLRVFDFDRAYAFPITNVLLYAIALYYVFKKLKAERKTVFLSVLFLACSPAVGYLWWASAEVFIFSFVTIAATNLINGSHRKAAFYISLAGSLNMSAMVIGIAVIFDYFWRKIAGTGDDGIKAMLREIKEKPAKYVKTRKFIAETFALAACFVPILIVAGFNIYHFGAVTPTAAFGTAQGWGGRFLSYLFDLNLGFFPYLQIAFILFIIFILYGMVKLKREAYVFAVALFGTTAVYALESHLNHGMTGISRYNAWHTPVIILFVCTQVMEQAGFCGCFKDSVKGSRIIKRVLVTLACMSLALCSVTSAWTLTKPSPALLTPMAHMALTYVPALYNPYPLVYIARVERSGIGAVDLQSYPEPVMYLQPNGYVRKILVPAGYDRSITWFEGNPEQAQALTKQMEERIGDKDYIYINVKKNWQVLPSAAALAE